MTRIAACTALPVVVLVALLAPAARADVPAPDFERVDHSRPQALLEIPPSLGDAAKIRSIASQLKRPTLEETLGAIGRWMRRNLHNDKSAATRWRPFEQMQKEGTYGSCADHAQFFGALARGCGIPVVWVKTMDQDWIVGFRGGTETAEASRGHVFLEVFDGKAWRLLDAEAGVLYEGYDPKTRLLPGGRFAYDKGGDPHALVLSCRWEEWLAQTKAYFATFDLSQIPWSRSRDLQKPWTLHVAVPEQGSEALQGWVREIAVGMKYDLVSVFGRNFQTWVPRARGATLVVTALGGKVALPDPWAAELLPPGSAAFLAARGDGKPDFLERRHDDGTRVILVRGDDQPTIQKALAQALRQ